MDETMADGKHGGALGAVYEANGQDEVSDQRS